MEIETEDVKRLILIHEERRRQDQEELDQSLREQEELQQRIEELEQITLVVGTTRTRRVPHSRPRSHKVSSSLTYHQKVPRNV